MLASLFQIDDPLGDRHTIGLGKKSSPPHPLSQISHLLRGQLSRRGHLQLFRFVSHRQHQPALVRLARNHGRSAVATGQQPALAVESQSPFKRVLGGMTFKAMFRQDGTNALLEELLVLSRSVFRAENCRQRSRKQQN